MNNPKSGYTPAEWAEIWDKQADRYEYADSFMAAKFARETAEAYRRRVVEK